MHQGGERGGFILFNKCGIRANLEGDKCTAETQLPCMVAQGQVAQGQR